MLLVPALEDVFVGEVPKDHDDVVQLLVYVRSGFTLQQVVHILTEVLGAPRVHIQKLFESAFQGQLKALVVPERVVGEPRVLLF